MQFRFKSFVVAIATASFVASTVSAATVNYILDLSGAPGTFTLKAQSPAAGDNFGLALYGIPLNGTFATLDHNSPKADFASGPGGNSPVGFTTFRTADGAGSNITLVGGQDTIGNPAGNLIRGMGQEASNFAAKGITPFAGAEGSPWLADLVLATGTYTGAAPSFNTSSVDLLANVFNTSSGSTVLPATVTTQVITGGGDIPPVANDLSLLNLSTLITPVANGTVTTSAGTPPITFGGLTFVSYTATNGGANDGNGGAGATLGANGAFSFPIDGRARGEYLFTYNATNAAGADSGNILVEVETVPEPTTLALFGLAMVGGLGLIRRRNG